MDTEKLNVSCENGVSHFTMGEKDGTTAANSIIVKANILNLAISGIHTGSTMNLYGGNLIAGTTKFGNGGNTATVTIDGANVILGNTIVNNGVTMNIVGASSTITMEYTQALSGSAINFTDGVLKFNESDGTAMQAFSTINILNYDFRIGGDLSVDMDTSVLSGDVVLVNGDLTQMLVTTTKGIKGTEDNTNSYLTTIQNATTPDGWKIELSNGNKDLILTPDATEATVADGVATVENLNGKDWIELTATSDQAVNALSIEYDGLGTLGTAETFADWFNDIAMMNNMSDATVVASVDENDVGLLNLTFSDLNLTADNPAYLYLNSDSYNSYYRNAFPEPSTWALLIIGATALVFMRRKR